MPGDSTKSTERTDGGVIKALLFILLAALVVRILALLSIGQTIYYDFLLWDERIYHDWAVSLADGTYQSDSVYEISPLPAYLFALLYRIFGPHHLAVRIMNLLLGTLSCLVIYLAGKEMFDRRTGLLSAGIAAVYAPLILFSTVPMKTALSVLLFLTCIWLTLLAIRKSSWAYALIAGITAAAALNVRPNYMILIPATVLVLGIWGYRSGHSRRRIILNIAAYLVAVIVAVVPVVYRNYRAAGEPVLLTSQMGYNIYIGNNVDSEDPFFRPLPFATTSPYEQGRQFTIEAGRRTGTKMSSAEASAYWIIESLKRAVKHPGPTIYRLFQKTLVLFNRYEAADHYSLEFIKDFAWIYKFSFLNFWMVFPFICMGIVLLLRSSKQAQAVLLLTAAGACVLVVFYTTARYRLPFVASLFPFAAKGILEARDFLRQRRHRALLAPGCAFIAALIVQFLPVKGTGDMTAYMNTHAFISMDQGKVEDALSNWKASSEAPGAYSGFANQSLARIYFNRGDYEKAVQYLNKVKTDSFTAAFRYELEGDMMMKKRDVPAAIEAYRKSIDINSGRLEPRGKLIRILSHVDPEKAKAEIKEFRYIESFYGEQ